MHVFIPSKGRPQLVAHNETRWSDHNLTWLVDDVSEAREYCRAGARRVRSINAVGRFGKAQCINTVLGSRELAGEWVLLTDDDVLRTLLWTGEWRAVEVNEVLPHLERAMAIADERDLPLVTGMGFYPGYWNSEPPRDMPDYHIRIGLPPYGRCMGTLHLVKVGRLPEIPVTYDDELMVTLRAVQTGGAVAESVRVLFLPDPLWLGKGGHGPHCDRGYAHSVEVCAREFPGLWEMEAGYPRVKRRGSW